MTIATIARRLAKAHVASPEVVAAGGASPADANDFPLREILRGEGLPCEREDCESLRVALSEALG